LAQHRVQRVAAPDLSLTIGGNVFATKLPGRKQAVGSGYAELRAPLLAENARFLPGLEVQLAARYDRASISSVTSNGEDQQFRPDIRVKREGLNYTLGAKFPVFPRLMFRASVATGEQYPTIGQLTPARDVVQSPESAVRTTPDPKRGGQPIGGGGPVLFLFGGDPGLKSERAVSLSFGFILNPSSLKGPRISIDYSRIDRRQEVVLFPLSPAELLTREADYPGRVLRAGLSQADIPLGFEAGPVTTIDIRPVNEGSTIVEALEVELNWKIPLISGSEIQLYGSGSWQPQLKTRLGAGRPWLKRLGFFDGPSAWRGNIGADWTIGSLAVGLNVQAFSGYRITFANPGNVDGVIFDNEELLSYQGRNWVPSQAYVDLAARRRFHLEASAAPLKTLEVRFGIQNLLDKPPPTVASPYAVPYSTYGDARLRRFELTLASRF
jgi:outer membrane receptor protein involved in Fe transport